MDRVQQPDPRRKVLSGKDRCKVRDLLLTKKESASRIQAYFSTPLLCLSSCASSFISTSIFINLLLASQGDRIQALTRISPQIDWYCSAQGMLGKKAPAFPLVPPFPLFPMPPTSSCFPLVASCQSPVCAMSPSPSELTGSRRWVLTE